MARWLTHLTTLQATAACPLKLPCPTAPQGMRSRYKLTSNLQAFKLLVAVFGKVEDVTQISDTWYRTNMSCMWQRLVDSVIYLCELWRHQFFWWQQLYQLPPMNSRPYVTPWCLTPCQSSYLKLCSHSSGGTCDYDDLTNGLESAKLTGNIRILTRTFIL